MPLAVIGAGFGRTGTLSLKFALEQLGFAPCHHMYEVFQNPEQAAVFHSAARGERVNWDALFARYRAQVDWPGCHFWRELSQRFPDAKVILSVREPEQWYRSISNTIFRSLQGDPAIREPGARDVFHMARYVVLDKTFANRTDKDHVLGIYNRHNEAVKAAIPAKRLLVFDPGDGWDALCPFLGVPVPDAPYPKSNTTEEFVARVAAADGQN